MKTILWLLIGPLLFCSLSPRFVAAAGKPNIIFILADDLGYGDLGCYGQRKIQTPNIDRLAAEGMKFTQFYSGASVCAPSRCVLMTGKNTGHCRVRGNAPVTKRAKQSLTHDEVTVAARLEQAAADAEAERRAANVAHRKRINNDALTDIVKAIGPSCEGEGATEIGKAIIAAIAKGEVQHVSIKY